MFLRRSTVIASQELKLVLRDPLPLLVAIVIPIALVAFIEPAVELLFRGLGSGELGAVQAVPGMAVMFVFMGTEVMGLGFYREHGWNTWTGASQLTSKEILVGKAAVYLATNLLQLTAIFAAGIVLFGLRLDGREVAGCLVLFLVLAITAVSFGFVVTVVTKTLQQLNAANEPRRTRTRSIGRALGARRRAPRLGATHRTRHAVVLAMRGFRIVLQDGGGVAEILPSVWRSPRCSPQAEPRACLTALRVRRCQDRGRSRMMLVTGRQRAEGVFSGV